MPLCLKWTADNLVHHVFEDDHFMSSCSKLQHKMDTALASYMEVCKDMQKKIKQLSITSFCTMYSVFLPVIHATTFNQPSNFKP
jgi:hypothetical protein